LLEGVQVDPTSGKVEELTKYGFQFKPEHKIFQNGKILFRFPATDFKLADDAQISVAGKIGFGTD
jgi:hypothetical protein